jgi:hypothetical protein
VSWLRSLLLATVLAAVCIASVPARGEHGDAKLVGDSVSYVAMVLGSSAAPAPFRYRIVVPAIARGLPLAPARALALVSLLSLVATYALVLRTSRRLGVPDKAAITGLCDGRLQRAAPLQLRKSVSHGRDGAARRVGVSLRSRCWSLSLVHGALRARHGNS